MKAGQLISSVLALATLTVIVTAGNIRQIKARARTERIMANDWSLAVLTSIHKGHRDRVGAVVST